MSQYIRRASWPVALAAVFLVASCGGDNRDAASLAQDSALARDLARVGADSMIEPQLLDVPAPETPAPSTVTPPPARPRTPVRRPTPPPAPPVTKGGNTAAPGPGTAERVGTIAAGSTLLLGSADKVCTNTNKVGDRFVATLNSAVSGSNGAVIPAGAAVTIELTQLKRSENANDQIQMGFQVINIAFGGKTYSLDGDVQTAEITRVRASSGGNDAKKVLGGAAAGAIIGQILGKKSKSTIIGAAAGAAAGGAAAAATANYEGCVNSGASIVVKLNTPVTVTTN
ncbi:MAG: hypothetical protein ABIZ91_06490 [Gemmatimonadaceae bacterium]